MRGKMAQLWEANLTVVHVVHDLSTSGRVLMTNEPLSTLQDHLEAEAYDHLTTLCTLADDHEIALSDGNRHRPTDS